MSKSQGEIYYPSVDLAYPIAVNSYEVAMKRLDTINGRLQTMTAITVTIFGGLTSFGLSLHISMGSFFFYCAALFCLVGVWSGLYGQNYGYIRLLKPITLWNGWTKKSQFEFQKDLLAYAATAYEENMSLVKFKWDISHCISVLLAFQVAALALWVWAGLL